MAALRACLNGFSNVAVKSLPDSVQKRPGEAVKAPLIVHVVRQFYPNRGGLEDVVMNLSTILLERGYRVRVITLDSLYTAPEVKLPAREMVKGIEVVRVPWHGSSRYPLAFGTFRHLADADLIHVHAIDFFFDALALGFVLHRRPMIATTHGGFFHTKRFALIKKLWFQTLTRLSTRFYRTVVCCSRSDTQLFSTIAPGRTLLIENGADTGKFRDCASTMPARRLVTIGRFSTNKGLDRLIDAMRALVSGDGRWHLDVVGVPGDISFGDLEGMIAARGLQGHVTIHCDLENAAIATLLKGCSLFVSASHYEGFGLVAVEAMSAGLLPVLHANEAFRLLAERHPQIELADFGDPAEAARAIERAYQALEAGGETMRNDLITAAGDYSWSRVGDRYLDVYSAVIGENGRRGP